MARASSLDGRAQSPDGQAPPCPKRPIQRYRRFRAVAVVALCLVSAAAAVMLLRRSSSTAENEKGFDARAWEGGLSISVLPHPDLADAGPYEQTNFLVRVRNENPKPIFVLAIDDQIMCQFDYRTSVTGSVWTTSDWLPDYYTDIAPFPHRIGIAQCATADFLFSPEVPVLLGYHRIRFPVYPFDEDQPVCNVRVYPAEPGRMDFEWPVDPVNIFYPIGPAGW